MPSPSRSARFLGSHDLVAVLQQGFRGLVAVSCSRHSTMQGVRALHACHQSLVDPVVNWRREHYCIHCGSATVDRGQCGVTTVDTTLWIYTVYTVYTQWNILSEEAVAAAQDRARLKRTCPGVDASERVASLTFAQALQTKPWRRR